MIIDLDEFFNKEKVYWDRLSKKLDSLDDNPTLKISYEEVSELYYLYKRAVSGLSKVRTFSVEREKIAQLNTLVARAYGYLHGNKVKENEGSFFKWLLTDVPQSFKRHMQKFALSVLFTVLGMMLGAGVLLVDYEAKPYVMPFSHLMGSPTERVNKEKESQGDNISGHEATFASQLMTHNVKVSIFALALGLTLGLGTFILLFYNGVILGAVLTDYIMDGQGVFLAGWLLPHGVIEIPAIIIAGQIGFIFAQQQMRTFLTNRFTSSSENNRKDVVNLFFCLVIMLVWAGLIEAFLSQYHEPVIKYSHKIMFGVVELVFLILYLSGKLGDWNFFAKKKI